MTRIAVLGANGQVAAEVSLILHRLGHQVVPICRGPGGSAYLRYMGLPVRHGSISDSADAARLIGDADLVANFALASGTPADIRAAHDRIIEASFIRSPRHARIIFFSTLAVNADFGPEDGPIKRSAYGREKLRNEILVATLARTHGREAIVLRLGHVHGERQDISFHMRALLRAGPVALPDPDRHANAVSTATIADAIAGIAEGRVPASGRYDLVNTPPWSWRELLDFEASRAGVAAQLETIPRRAPAKRGVLTRIARTLYRSELLKSQAGRLLGLLPAAQNDRVRARYFAQRAAREIAAISEPPVEEIAAARYRGQATQVPPGLRDTRALLNDPRYIVPAEPIAPSWPAMD